MANPPVYELRMRYRRRLPHIRSSYTGVNHCLTPHLSHSNPFPDITGRVLHHARPSSCSRASRPDGLLDANGSSGGAAPCSGAQRSSGTLSTAALARNCRALATSWKRSCSCTSKRVGSGQGDDVRNVRLSEFRGLSIRSGARAGLGFYVNYRKYSINQPE